MTILLVNAAATWCMTGLIWFVQVVHYPLFAAVGAADFATYHRAHGRRTTWVVLPVMAIELATAIGLAWRPPPGVPAAAAWLGLLLVGVVWASTGLVQVRRHAELAHGYQPAIGRALVTGNWLRTAAWSARAVLVLWLVQEAIGAQP